jgi:hypothetical protein
MTDFAERFGQIIGSVTVILDHEQAHGAPVRLRLGSSATGALPVNIGRDGHRSHQF